MGIIGEYVNNSLSHIMIQKPYFGVKLSLIAASLRGGSFTVWLAAARLSFLFAWGGNRERGECAGNETALCGRRRLSDEVRGGGGWLSEALQWAILPLDYQYIRYDVVEQFWPEPSNHCTQHNDISLESQQRILSNNLGRPSPISVIIFNFENVLWTMYLSIWEVKKWYWRWAANLLCIFET